MINIEVRGSGLRFNDLKFEINCNANDGKTNRPLTTIFAGKLAQFSSEYTAKLIVKVFVHGHHHATIVWKPINTGRHLFRDCNKNIEM